MCSSFVLLPVRFRSRRGFGGVKALYALDHLSHTREKHHAPWDLSRDLSLAQLLELAALGEACDFARPGDDGSAAGGANGRALSRRGWREWRPADGDRRGEDGGGHYWMPGGSRTAGAVQTAKAAVMRAIWIAERKGRPFSSQGTV